MSNSKFQLTGENTNLARVAQMILGPCTNVLRDVLRKELSPSELEKKVRAYIANTMKPLINKHQETLVYGKDYSKFDVTLLYFLLRNMCSIQPHSNKWGNNPNPGDKSMSANIDRIRLIRNEYGHNSERSISHTDFNIKYQYIKDIVQELENYLGSSSKYQDEVKELQTCTMDPTQCEKNIKELLDLHEKIKDISGDVNEMKNTVLPWNIKVIYGKDVLKWKEDDIFFVETHNFQPMLDKVRQQPFVMFVGVPGSGKTATARHIALLLQEKDGYEILPTKDIKDTETYCDPRNPQVFVIDDVLGVFGFDMKELEKLAMYKDRLNKPTMPETKILMTCREVVFNHEAFSGSFLSNENHVVQLHSEDNALNDQDKYDLFAKYNLDKDLLSADIFSKTSKSFPYLCKLFSRKEELRHYGPQFFISPVPCILELLDNLKIKNKVHYASLVILMINQNVLSEKTIKDEHTKYFDELKCQVLKRCKVDPTTCSFYFNDALTEMVGTYTEQRQSEFKFIHDSMLEIVAYHFGCQFPELILQYMDSDYIANYIKPDKYKCKKRKREEEEDKLEQFVNAKEDSDTVVAKENVHDLCIKLQESHYHILADRLYEDIRKGELFNVFENEALKHPLVLQKFLDVIESKSYSELFAVFLSEFKEQQVKRAKTSEDHLFSSNCYNLLINARWIDEDDIYTCARAIDWVIFYGHNLILQFIINQIIKNTNAVDDLFRTPFNIRSNDFCSIADETDCNERKKSDINEKSTRSDVSDDISWSDLCSETDFGTEKVIFEKLRLLNLSCYSGDLLTFQTLLPYYNKDVLFSESWWVPELFEEYDLFFNENDDWHISDPPIVVACKTGHLNILLELLNCGANVNDNSLSCTPLIFACSEGHLDIVIELLKHGADVNITGTYHSPLTAACSNKHFDIAIELLKQKPNVNITLFGNSPLIIVCSYGNLDMVLELLKHGADVNITVFTNSPLFAACSNGHLNIVVELLKHGADVNKKVCGETPLLCACLFGYLDIVVELLKHGADVNITLPYNSPVIAACSNGHVCILRELLKKGADVNITVSEKSPLIVACSKGNLAILHELLKHGADVNITSQCNSPVVAACSNGHVCILRELLKKGADVNITVFNNSPLIAACSEGHLDILLELLKHGADVNTAVLRDKNTLYSTFPVDIIHKLFENKKYVNIKNVQTTPLIAACSNRCINIASVQELLKHGADVNLTVTGASPLIVACAVGRCDVVLELLKHGADVNVTVFPYSPLIAACSNKSKSLDIISELLKREANVNRIVSDKLPLIVACSEGYLDMVCELLKHGADVNCIVSDKLPLIAACKQGQLDIVFELLKHGADVNMTSLRDSPLIAACSKGHLDIIRELFRYGVDANITVSDYSPLIAACSEGYCNVINELLKHGADVNIIVSGRSPLTALCSIEDYKMKYNLYYRAAATYGKTMHSSYTLDFCLKVHLDTIRKLIEHGADVNGKNCTYSPLIAACSKGRLNIVGELLKHGVDVNITFCNKAPLLAACSKGHLNIVNELLKHGADVNITVSDKSPLIAACNKGYLDIIKLLLKHGADINMTVSGYSPLTILCLNCDWQYDLLNKAAYANTISDDTLNRLSFSKVHFAIIRKLLNHGAEVNVKHCKESPLNASCSNGHLNIVHELLKHGADVNTIVFNKSPLITACSYGRLDMVLELLKKGADVNITVYDNSPIIAACSKGHLDIVNELIKHGADVNITVCHNSPLIAACSKGFLNIVNKLLNHGSQVNMTVFNNSPLIAACSYGCLDLIFELLKNGADVNIGVPNNYPLIAACSKGKLDVVLGLLKNGADVNITVYDNSPIIAACSKGHLDIVNELIKHGADVNITVCHNSPLIAACSEGHLDMVLELLKYGANVHKKVSDNSPFIAACSKGHLDIMWELLNH